MDVSFRQRLASSTRASIVNTTLTAFVAFVSCTRGEPPAPQVSPSTAAPEPLAPSAERAVPGNGAATLDAMRETPGTPAATAAVDPGTLPQTRERPAAAGPAFESRVLSLWNAVVADDPQQAIPFFFPLGAYEQVKDIPDPASDWKRRLWAAFARDIHALHARLGHDAARAQLDKLDVPEPRARWVEPGEEYNKIGYFRVFGSVLRYTVDGAGHAFEVKSLISWRGEWYVVHLSAIK